MSETGARLPEQHKRIGVSYAVTDDGVELPVIDITHPAFAIRVSREELSGIADRTLRSLKRSAKMPRLVQLFVRRRSILVRQTIESSGGYLSGMATYLQKLGPGNLGRAYAGRLDRRIAGSIGPVSNRLRLQETSRLIADELAPSLTAAPAHARVHLLNIGGGPAMDSINALILINKEYPALLAGRHVDVHVLDIDSAGPRFGARAVAALSATGAPLNGLDGQGDRMARAVYVLDAWNDTTQTSVIALYTTRKKAEQALERLLKRPGRWYAGVVKRTVR